MRAYHSIDGLQKTIPFAACTWEGVFQETPSELRDCALNPMRHYM